MSKTFAVFVVLLDCSIALGNIGGFRQDAAHTIRLVPTAEIQLQSEEVAVKYEARADVRCKFRLVSKSRHELTVHVGFPLDPGPTIPEDELPKAAGDAATLLVFDYKFIARDEDHTYHVRYVPYDADKKFNRIFLWDMTFAPGQVRVLNVAYQLPLAGDWGFGPSDRGRGPWNMRVGGGYDQWFRYVTETGNSWAGPIQHATFTVDVGGYEKAMANVPLDGLAERQKREETQEQDSILSGTYQGDWLIHRQIKPDGWREQGGVICWDFKDYHPKSPIEVRYALRFIPTTRWAVRAVVNTPPAAGLKREDLEDLRELMLATWGMAPKSESLRKFVASQTWYVPKPDVTIDRLGAGQKAALDEFDRFLRKKQGR